MDRNNGDAWEGLVDIVSVPWDVKEVTVDKHFRREYEGRGNTKDEYFERQAECFLEPKVPLSQVFKITSQMQSMDSE